MQKTIKVVDSLFEIFLGLSTTQQLTSAMLAAFGLFFFLLGILMIFDRSFLALGNFMFLCGACVFFGPVPIIRFVQESNTKFFSLLWFLFGTLVIAFGWVYLGLLIEIYFALVILYDNTIVTKDAVIDFFESLKK